MSFEKQDSPERKDFEGSRFREEVFSESVRAGKRTYFFDVKSTRKNELYLTITESKKRNSESGNPFYEKHKIFLYKEDFEKFSDGLLKIIDYIKENQIGFEESDFDVNEEEFSSLEFEDLSR